MLERCLKTLWMEIQKLYRVFNLVENGEKMSANLRLYIRSINKVIFEINPLIATFLQLKSIFKSIEEVPKKPKVIQKNIFESKTKLEKTKSIINQSNKYSQNSSFINFVR